MDQSPDKKAGDGADGQKRQDHRQHDIVELGILMQQSDNSVAALEYLKARNIDPQVIRRVLLEPERRRGSKMLL
jgi:hypothetical protein